MAMGSNLQLHSLGRTVRRIEENGGVPRLFIGLVANSIQPVPNL
jgi:hypothetical protein